MIMKYTMILLWSHKVMLPIYNWTAESMLWW